MKTDFKMYCENCRSMQFIYRCQPDTNMRRGRLAPFRCFVCNDYACFGMKPCDFAEDETAVDGNWLQAIGFNERPCRFGNHEGGKYFSIVADNFDGTSGKARVELHLSSYLDDGVWVTDFVSYGDEGEVENEVGLVGSWCKTRADVVRLCEALIESWRE